MDRETVNGDPPRCEYCGCKVIRGAHYGAFEACARIKRLTARVADLTTETKRLAQIVERLIKMDGKADSDA